MASQTEQHLLSVGRQCSHQSCLLVDFLPFKCQHCDASFCQEHFMVSAHKCPKYDETKYNRVSPNCPLCNVVVSVRPGQDANEAVETHFVRDCSVMTGKAKAKSTPICARARCGKALFAPIQCTKCHQQFCPAHRFPADHTCTPTAQTKTTGPTAASRLLDLNAKASAAGGAALGAIKTMASNAQSQASSSSSRPAAAPAPKAPAAAAPSKPNLFSKTDRYFSPYPSAPTRDDTKPSNPTSTTASLANAILDDVNADKTTTTTTDTNMKSAPEPAIRPNSFVPPPIFASA